MLFAKGTKGLRLNLDHLHLEVVDIVDGDWAAAGVLVHDERNRTIAHMLVEMPFGPFPMALGVIYDDPAPTFESAVVAQNTTASQGKVADLQKLVSKGRSEEHTSELQSLMRTSYAVFCLKKKKTIIM